MDGYTPIPFARPPIDQTAERLKLADLLYQANMARVQAEQERQMTYARMIAQTGQMIGSGIEDYLTRQQKERALAIQAERENRLASAQEAQNAMMMQRMAAEDARNTLALQENLYDKMAGGATMYGGEDEMRQRLGPYADLMQFSPELTATQQRITPAETLQVGPSAMPAQPGVLESRPMNLAVLAGTAEPTTTTYEASLTKPYSAEEQQRMDVLARAESERQKQEMLAKQKQDNLNALSERVSAASTFEAKRREINQALITGLIDAPEANALMNGIEPITPTSPKFRFEKIGNQVYRINEATGEGAPVMLPETAASRTGAGQINIFGTEGDNPLEGASRIDQQAAIRGLSPTASPQQRAAYVAQLKMLSKDPNDRNAFVYGNVIGNLPTEQERTRAASYASTIATLSKWEKILTDITEAKKRGDELGKAATAAEKAFQSGGFSENMIRQMAQYFGKVSNVPEMAQLNAEIMDFLQLYRQSRTGLAFTAAETSEYKDIVPSTGGEPDLNLQKTRGLLNRTKQMHGAFWNQRLGQGGASWASNVEKYNQGSPMPVVAGANPYRRQ